MHQNIKQECVGLPKIFYKICFFGRVKKLIMGFVANTNLPSSPWRIKVSNGGDSAVAGKVMHKI